MNIVAGYAIGFAILILGMWAYSIVRGGVPELLSRPWETRHRIVADALMTSTLLGGGIATLIGRSEGPTVLAIGLGMAMYSIVNSIGYFVQRRHVRSIVTFAMLLSLTAVATGLNVSAS